MLKAIKAHLFPTLVVLSALSLAGAAAFFSVSGLSKLFGGAESAVIIMASSLEIAKLVTASFLHRHWNTINWKLRTYLTAGTVTIMLITSAGIYGFLSSAYSETSNKLENIDGQIGIIEQKKQIINDDIARLEESKQIKFDRIQSLITLRTQQETRVDSLYNKGRTTAAKRVEEQIVQSSLEITRVTVETDSLGSKIQRKSEEIGSLDAEILNLKNNDVASEIGPLKYIANLTGRSMDSVVNFFILLLIFVFDPMAVCLVIASNIALSKIEQRKQSNTTPPQESSDPKPIIQEPPTNTMETNQSEDTREKIEYVSNENGDFVEKGSQNQPIDNIEDNPSTEGNAPINEEREENIDKNKDALSFLKELSSNGKGNDLYKSFIDTLYLDGSLKVGDTLPPYNKFIEALNSKGVKFKEKDALDFITICNLFKITNMYGKEKKIAKDYDVAKELFNVISN